MLLAPDLMVNAVHDVSPQVLRDFHVRAVMVDLDDTLVASNSDALAASCKDWVTSLKQQGFPVLILSNGHGPRVQRCATTLEITGFSMVGKPFGFAFRRGLNHLGSQAHETVMIGDQLFTDVLGAKLAGLKSILVTPLTKGWLPHTRLARKLETLVLKGGDDGRSIYRR